MSKDSLVKGTIILAVAALVARVLGLLQRVPLQHLLGDGGMATFGIAFNIYTMMLTIATAGIPSALSKLVSERVELGQHEEANRIYRAAIYFAVAAGVLMTALVYFVAPSYTRFTGDDNALLSIRALAPALLFFPIIAMMRGYFQGRQSMMPNGISQIVEQILRLVTAIGLVVLLLDLGLSQAWAVAGASFGGVMGAVGALAIMVYYYIRLRRRDRGQGFFTRTSTKAQRQETYKQIYKRIFHLSIPIVLYSILVPLIYTIDSSFFIGLLKNQLGLQQAKDLLGILTARAQSFAGIPIILAISISQSIVPIISSAFARKDMDQVKSQASKALRISVLSGLPVILLIVTAGGALNGLLFANDSGTGVIIALTASTIFQILMQTSGAILMGLGRMRVLIYHVFVGVAVKAASVFALASWLGVYGFVASTALCFGVMTLLNMRVLRREAGVRIFTLKSWEGLALSTAIICVCGSLIESLGESSITWFYARVNYFLTASLVGGAVLILYGVLLMLTRVVTKEDIAALPAPIRKLLGRTGTKIAAK